jgi:molybdate transport system substrate-binding protein
MSIELTLVAPGGIRTALQHLLPGYEKATGNKVVGSYVSGGATKQKIVDGELFDVPVIQPPYDTVLASRNIDAKSETPLATVSVVAAVRAGVPKPDISNGEALKKFLLSVKSISCPSIARGAACGVSFEATLVKLGIKDAVGPKIVAVQSGWESVKMLGRGEVELGITFASENDPSPDVQMLGALPRDVSIPTGFVGFAHARTPHRDAVTALLKYLSTAEAARIFTECGMTPGK